MPAKCRPRSTQWLYKILGFNWVSADKWLRASYGVFGVLSNVTIKIETAVPYSSFSLVRGSTWFIIAASNAGLLKVTRIKLGFYDALPLPTTMPTFASSITSIVKTTIRFHSLSNALLERINNAITETTIRRSQQSVQELDLCARSALQTLLMEVFKDATEGELVLDALLTEEITQHLVTYRNPSPPNSPLEALNQAYHRANQGLGPLGVESMVHEMYSGIVKPLFARISKLRTSFTDGELDMSMAAASTPPFPKTSVAAAAALDMVSVNGDEAQALAKSSEDLSDFLAGFTFTEELRVKLSALTNDLDEIEEKERTQYFELGVEVIRLGLAVSLSNTYDLAIAHRLRKLFIHPPIIDAIELTVQPPIRPGAILYFFALKFNQTSWDDLRETIKEVFLDSGLVNAAFKIVTTNEPWLLKLVPKRMSTQEPYDPAYEAFQTSDLGPPMDEADEGL